MQNLSNSWQFVPKSESYGEEMAEDGDGPPGVTSSSSSPSSSLNNFNNRDINNTHEIIGSNGEPTDSVPGSIVNSLLSRKTGSYFGGGESSPGSGLEQKIKELKAEKEASSGGEAGADNLDNKCPPRPANAQDSPIDFSVKRRPSFSGSLTDDSQGSSCSPPNTGDYRGLSPSHDFTNTLNTHDPHDGDVNVKHEVDDSFYGEDQNHPDILMDHQRKVPSPSVSGIPPLLNGMAGLPGIPSSFLTNGTTSAMENFARVISAATKGNNNEQHRNNRKNSRPFKAYPKEALQLPLGFLGMPDFTALQQGMDSGVFAGMSSNEIMSLYNQQLQLFKEKHLSSSGKNSPPSQISSTTSLVNGNNNSNNNTTNNNYNNRPNCPQQPHLINNQHSPPHSTSTSIPKHQIHSPGLAPPISSSPPLYNSHDQGSPPPHFSPNHHQHRYQHDHHPTSFSPDHLKTNNSLTTSSASSSIINVNHNHNTNPFPIQPPLSHLSNNNSTLNSSSNNSNTLVSSTSSSSPSPFSHHNLSSNNHNNQRKRPRSLPDEQKDEAYWERRRKNNDAAKRSRDARRAKEDEIALRAALLEQENLKLRVEVAALKTETARLRCMLYNT